MFLLLVIAVILHQIYATMNEKSNHWPLRKFYIRLVECAGRVGIFPIAGIFFVKQINHLPESFIIGVY